MHNDNDKDIQKPDLREGIAPVAINAPSTFAGTPPVTSAGDGLISPEAQVPAGQTTHE